MTDNVMQYRVRTGGPWQALLPGVYLGVSGAPSLAQKEMAALLYAGSPADWERTRRRHDLMGAAGIIPLHFSPNKIRREPAEVAQLINGALERGLQRPPLPIRTIPCPTSAQAIQ